jgi:molybdenum cofactor synthesis domain-containing protein
VTQEHITAGIVIIGNEILSGRTLDTNNRHIALELLPLGIEVVEVRVVPDIEEKIVEAVNALRCQYTYVFTTGGIGATHDDITVASIAKAFDRPLVENQEALSIIKNHYNDRFNSIRARMALMPENVTLIQNSVSRVPSFQIDNVFVLAGMPSVMKAMLNDVLPRLKKGAPFYSNSITSNLHEGVIGDALAHIQNQYPAISIGSYPFYNSPTDVGTTLVLKGKDTHILAHATQAILSMVYEFGGTPVVERSV